MINRRGIAALTLSLAAPLLLAACGSSAVDASGKSTEAIVSTAQGGGSAADIAFAQLMIPHHQQAVEMSDLALATADSPEVRQLAEQIKGAQDPEIAVMTGWLEGWGAPLAMGDDHSGHDMGGMSMDGMMSDADMAALASATGPEFDRTWTEMMIAHHEGAVAMAREVLAKTASAKVAELAQDVIDGQTAEITAMESLLGRIAEAS